jgi:hypothetical protein
MTTTSQPSAAPRFGRAAAFRVVSAALIATGVAWMLGMSTISRFMAVFGDCFSPEACEGYYGMWATTARFSELIVVLGWAVIVLAVAAVFFRVAQVVLIGVSASMIGTVVLSYLFDLRALWLPGPDVWLGNFTIVFLLQIPAAFFWMGGAAMGLLTSRATKDTAGPSEKPNS